MINKNNINKIEFVFENCEVVTIPWENISNFDIHINNENEVDNLTMTIKDDNSIDGYIFDKIRPFARLNMHNDITWIELYSNNQVRKHSICWDNDDEYRNSFQHNELVDAYTLNININTYKPRFPYVDTNEIGEIVHIEDKEMIKVYGDFVMVDKEFFKELILKTNDKELYEKI
ncbi:hypothetical protein G8V07_14575 [Clostridium botulinum D/C]|uniref:hypothetical protein n=1 Tax=Clostridium botulinum TaxID=1491 RepID=UPI001E636B5F|nr:hypothetical protein [Clostridium botulinum]MCD3321669.1 hypothetical protein [Clostridium botulinum D/C]MCD3324949.1 hypothetical protein [Clostridium botulinum D/C]MCD3327727.1 hypothetical protein [Clostridium botulinum D/C]